MMIVETCNKNEKNNLEINKLLDYIIHQPVWIKHYIYSELRENLKYQLNVDSPYIRYSYVQNYVPKPAKDYQLLLKKRFNPSILELKSISVSQLAFLKSVEGKKNLIEICNENNWSLKECCNIFVSLIDKMIIEPIESCYLANSIYYLAGKIRLCEYLVRLNKISLEQVDKALYVQKEMAVGAGERPKIGDLLVNMGYINDEDKNDIICLKDNSDLSCNLIDQKEVLQHRINELEIELESKNFENEGYKQDLIDFQEELLRQSEIILKLQNNKSNKDKNNLGFYHSFLVKLFHLESR